MGFTVLTVGYDPESVGRCPGMTSLIDEFLGKVKAIEGGQFVDRQYVKGYRFNQDSMERNINLFIDTLAELTESTKF